MAKTLPTRADIPAELCWDISKLFPNDEACRKALEDLIKRSGEFAARYKGMLGRSSAAFLIEAVKDYEALSVDLHRTGTYPSLRVAVDMNDSSALSLDQDVNMGFAGIMAELSFFTGEIAELPEALLNEAMTLAPEYAVYLGNIRSWQKHQLSPETESVLAALAPQLNLPSNLYEIMKQGDLRFPAFEASGEQHPLSYTLYENNYCAENDTELRRKAFRTFSDKLLDYHQSTAAIYNSNIQGEKTLSRLRGFDSVFDYLLYSQKVPREQYERHLDLTMELLAPVMRRWAKALQKAHGLSEMRYSDLKILLDPDFAPEVNVEGAQDYILKAMEPMGKEYSDMIMRAFPERWCDFAQNLGKSTGGFCTVPPKAQPYILLNWNGGLGEVFTLVHELGHAAQGLLCEKHNAPLQADFTLYDIEAPSTFHEMLLSRSLLKEAKDKRFERWVYASMIENTYYHNFVTHFLEGYWQREVYRLVDQGVNLQAEDFDRLFKETLEKFWGDAVILDEGAELTWMRQPHYYNGLYSYTYSASLVISTEMYRRIQNEGEAAVSDWLKYLAAGGPMQPIEHAALAGIDISDDRSLRRTIEFISEIVNKVEELS